MRKSVYDIMRKTKVQVSLCIHAVVICRLVSIIPIFAKSKFSSLWLVSVAEQTGLSLYLVANLEGRFSHDMA